MNKKYKMSYHDAMKINRRALALMYKHFPGAVMSTFVSAVWGALTPYVGIYLSALIISELAGAKDKNRLITLVLISLISAAAISLVSALINKWKNVKNSYNWNRMWNIFSQKMLDADFAVVDDSKTQEHLSIVMQNENGGGWGLTRVLGNYSSLISNIATFIGGISLTVTLFVSRVPDSAGGFTVLNSPLFIAAIAAILVTVTLVSPVISTRAGSYYAKNSKTHNYANRLFGFFGFLGFWNEKACDVRIYDQEKMCDKYNIDKESTFNSSGPFAKMARGKVGILGAASAAVSVIFTAAAYVFVCLKAWAGAFGVGEITMYISSLTRLSGGLSGLISTIGDMRNNASFLKTAFEFLDIPNPMYQGSLSVEKRSDRNYEIEFRNVSFKYPGSDSFALKNVNMKFRIGERLAVVGMNGSGKTTFIKLLCRLYDPTEGEILLNGINIRKYDYYDYLSVFSVVFQDFNLFSLPLGQNVGAGVNYDRERVEKCLCDAGFGERLKELPFGLETYLYKNISKDGIEISGGEAQKIALARALYKNAPFIILDEPTAALDPIAEAEIYSNFNNIVGDKTAIYISHRLSSCRFCDEIAVFDKGQVVQKGTHDELVSDEGGKYHELWYAQAQYYTEKE